MFISPRRVSEEDMQKIILALNAATMINLIQKIIQNLNNKIKSHSPSNLAIKKMYLF